LNNPANFDGSGLANQWSSSEELHILCSHTSWSPILDAATEQREESVVDLFHRLA
jgi:hypothetical protein